MLGWRPVPVVSSAIGWLARSQEPVMEQLLIGRGTATPRRGGLRAGALRHPPPGRALGRRGEHPGRPDSGSPIASCSARTIVYKGMLKPDQLAEYFPDLSDPGMESALALVHSRYSTNTFPQWGLAQPFHLLAHNGEINTLQGNVHWLQARAAPDDAAPSSAPTWPRCSRCEFEGLSDSAILDQALELLVRAGRSLPHALHDAGARGVRGPAPTSTPRCGRSTSIIAA